MVTLPPTGNGAGQILYAMRFNSRFDAACRVTNRTSGTVSPLPVLREKDIFQPKDYGTTDFLGVPRPPNSRIVLRVWLFTHVAGTYANVRAEGANGSATDTLALTRLSDGLLFGTSDITRQIDAAGAPVRVSTSFAVDDYYDGHAWLLLTMTDNETGRVTVVPH